MIRKLSILFVIGFLFIMLQGCTGATNKVVKSDNGQAYSLEEVYSIGLFTPTWQFRKASACDIKITRIKTTNHGTGYDSETVENCRVIGVDDGFAADTTSPVGPMLLQAGGTVGAGALIGDGIRDSSDNINNTNQQGQLQGQAQGQLQGQIQGQKQGVKVQGGCRGNCGGGSNR